MIELQGSTARAVVDLCGGRLTSLEVTGHELLADARGERSGPAAWFHGSFPLAPWAGTPPDPVLRPYGVSLGTPANPSASHGTVVDSTWRLTRAGDDGMEIETTLAPPWPWHGVVRQRFELADDRLAMALEVEAGESFPVVLGFHPWFRRRVEGVGDAELDFAADARWEVAPDGSGHAAPATAGRDGIHTGVRSAPVITWGNALALRLESAAEYLIVFDRLASGFCVEPWTDTPDRFARGDVRPLEPGGTALLEFVLVWSFRDPV